jgi:hypothetical protein
MRPIYLRRTKESLDREGKSIFTNPLPEMKLILEKIPFSSEESELY